MKKIIRFLSIALILFGLKQQALAQGLNSAKDITKGVAKDTGVTETNVGSIVGFVLNAALSLVGLIFLILMVYAGYLWMTARGEEEPIKKAQKIIVGSVIGLVILLGAYAITIFITAAFEGVK